MDYTSSGAHQQVIFNPEEAARRNTTSPAGPRFICSCSCGRVLLKLSSVGFLVLWLFVFPVVLFLLCTPNLQTLTQIHPPTPTKIKIKKRTAIHNSIYAGPIKGCPLILQVTLQGKPKNEVQVLIFHVQIIKGLTDLE